jgi:ABC-type sugar transport system ATPase subunit
MDLLTVSGISKKDETGFELRNIFFSVAPFQKTAIAGETGSGKSTLLKIIAGLAQPGSGTVLFNGEKIAGPSEKLIPGHKGIAYLSQHFELRNKYRVEEELDYLNQMTDAEAEMIYEICRIRHLLKRWTNQVSGGERQRIVLARLLVSAPKLLLLDEPFSNLDLIHKNILKAVINDVSEKFGITCILVSHDAQDILSWADDIIIMRDGAIVEMGSPQKIYQTPSNEYIAGLFGKYNLLPAAVVNNITASDAKKIFLRPEQLRISHTEGIIKGQIKAVNFLGDCYEIEVVFPEGIIVIQSQHNHYAKGEMVGLLVAEGKTWYL